MTSVATRARPQFWPALVCAVLGFLVFQFLGNSTRGYIGTSSLFYWWGFQWFNPQSETQHGILILGISAWIFVRNLRATAPATAPSGGVDGRAGAAMLGGLLVHDLGFVAEQARVSILGLLLFAWGLAAMTGGARWARAAVFPLGFMVFAIPLNALDSLGFWLRMGVVSVSAWVAHATHVGVIVNGSQLLSVDGRYDYDVAAACSGVRSLVALAALSLLVGYLRFRPFWLRAAFLGVSLPLIFVGNVARIVAIVYAAQWGGQAWGDRVHAAMGFGVFVIVLGGVLALAEWTGRRRPEWEAGGRGDRSPDGYTGGEPRRSRPWPAVVMVSCLCVASGLFLYHISRLPGRGRVGISLAEDGRSPVQLPTFLGQDWIGRRAEVTEIEKQVLPQDTGFSRKLYVSLSDPSKQVFLSIVLSGTDRTSIHRPELCLVGQGWTIRGSFRHSFRYPQSEAVPATVLRVERAVMTPRGQAVVPQLVAYYFVTEGTIAATSGERLAVDAWNRVAHGRADRWAYVLLQTGAGDGEDAALDRIQVVLNATLPAFQPDPRFTH